MAKNSIVFGIIIIVVSIAFYIGTYQASMTALIPGIMGIAMIICGLLARKENIRKHLMHVSAVIALIGFIATAEGVLRLIGMLDGAEVERSIAFIEMAISSVIFLIYVILSFQSFCEARRERRGGESEQ